MHICYKTLVWLILVVLKSQSYTHSHCWSPTPDDPDQSVSLSVCSLPGSRLPDYLTSDLFSLWIIKEWISSPVGIMMRILLCFGIYFFASCSVLGCRSFPGTSFSSDSVSVCATLPGSASQQMCHCFCCDSVLFSLTGLTVRRVISIRDDALC